jgi:hypothetical protein
MTSEHTWQGRLLWSMRFIGVLLVAIGSVRSGPAYIVGGVACFVASLIVDYLIPDEVRRTRPRKRRPGHARSPNHG